MKEMIKIGFVGLGRRSKGILRQCFMEMKDVEVSVICDIDESRIADTLKFCEEKGFSKPKTTTSFDEMISDKELDAVVISNGWRGRAELACKAMYAGKYTAIEVGGAYDIKECYDLIEAYEKTGSPLMMLENCCYGRLEMMALNVAEKGELGEIIHCDGGYHHFLPDCELLYDVETASNPHYRIYSYINRNCEQYPTHELGPISKLLKLNRGNRILTVSSTASKAAGLKSSAQKLLGSDSLYSNIDYKQGDIITTVIKCSNGETVHLCLDTTLPRAYYSRNFTVRGTKGMISEEGQCMFFDGMEEPCKNNLEEMYEKYDHPLHREYVELGEKGGHGGMDWLVCRAFAESVKRGTDTPINAYDTVLWMAVTPLSEQSVALGGAPVAMPDFTKGKWTDYMPIVEGKYCLDKVIEDKNTEIY